MLLKLTTMLLCVVAMAWPADPFAGTWKVDVVKSLYGTGTPPASLTITIAESGANEDTTVAVVTAMARKSRTSSRCRSKVVQAP